MPINSEHMEQHLLSKTCSLPYYHTKAAFVSQEFYLHISFWEQIPCKTRSNISISFGNGREVGIKFFLNVSVLKSQHIHANIEVEQNTKMRGPVWRICVFLQGSHRCP